ncbi:MAG: XRE family transcriptional regulator [Mycobacterium sp.]
MTLAADRRPGPAPHRSSADRRPGPSPARASRPAHADEPVEFWPTSAIQAALEGGDIATWKKIAVALKRDPFGRTARQVEEVLETARPYGISKALAEVLDRARAHLEANEREEVARHVRVLIQRSGLKLAEFASRIGVPVDELTAYLDAKVSPPAALMIRMRRLSDRFAKANPRLRRATPDE